MNKQRVRYLPNIVGPFRPYWKNIAVGLNSIVITDYDNIIC